jgi:hypothetical protein
MSYRYTTIIGSRFSGAGGGIFRIQPPAAAHAAPKKKENDYADAEKQYDCENDPPHLCASDHAAILRVNAFVIPCVLHLYTSHIRKPIRKPYAFFSVASGVRPLRKDSCIAMHGFNAAMDFDYVPNYLEISKSGTGTLIAKYQFVILSRIKSGAAMSKQVITSGGEDHVVREDTAKSFRGVYWALASLAAFVIIVALLFFTGFFSSLIKGNVDSPATIERQAGR